MRFDKLLDSPEKQAEVKVSIASHLSEANFDSGGRMTEHHAHSTHSGEVKIGTNDDNQPTLTLRPTQTKAVVFNLATGDMEGTIRMNTFSCCWGTLDSMRTRSTRPSLRRKGQLTSMPIPRI